MGHVLKGNRSNQHIKRMSNWYLTSKEVGRRKARRQELAETLANPTVVSETPYRYIIGQKVCFKTFKHYPLGKSYHDGYIVKKRRILGEPYYTIKTDSATFHDVSWMRIFMVLSLGFKAEIGEHFHLPYALIERSRT